MTDVSEGRVLFVDDQEDWRETIGGVLQDAGYQVKTASEPGEALALLQREPFHVAVVDLCFDEADQSNRDGLQLARQMKAQMPELAIIILTAFADTETTIEALALNSVGERLAVDLLQKHQSSILLSRVATVFTQKAQVNPGLEIALQPPLTWYVIQQSVDCLRSLSLESAVGEIRDLLQRIFYNKHRIEISELNRGHSSGAVLLVTPFVDQHKQTTVVVKFNEREKAEQESRHYRQYVQDYVGGARRTQQLETRATAKLGGIAYSFVGTEMADALRFGDLYGAKTAAEITVILDNLFRKTCATWYRNSMELVAGYHSLSGDYLSCLGIQRNGLADSVRSLVRSSNGALQLADEQHPERGELTLTEACLRLPNPLSRQHAAFPHHGAYCYTHGDLHENNVLVDSSGHAWLIDFYRTGLGHPVRDFAMLESAIKLYLHGSPCSDADFHQWHHGLLEVSELGAAPRLHPALTGREELEKATAVIAHLRKLMRDLLPEATVQEYFVALYFHALKAITLDNKLDEQQRRFALVAAAQLVEYL